MCFVIVFILQPIFMAVNTPTKTSGEGKGYAADLTFIEKCAENIALVSKSDKIVIEKSTLPVRTAERIKEILDLNKDNINRYYGIFKKNYEGLELEDVANPNSILIQKRLKIIKAYLQIKELKKAKNFAGTGFEDFISIKNLH